MGMIKSEIIEGDVIEVLKTLPSNKFHLVFTSPPYNVGMDYGRLVNDRRSWEEYYGWCGVWIREIYCVLRPDGRFGLVHYLSLGDASHREAPLLRLESIVHDAGFQHHGLAIWNDSTLSKRTAWGSYCSASAPYINSPFEGILISYKSQWKKRDRGKSDISKCDFEMATSGIWNAATEHIYRDRHPAPFSLRLATIAIRLLTYSDDWVLDPFSGTGTTLAAAKRIRRHSVGIEINPEYVKIARKRLDNITVTQSWGKYDDGKVGSRPKMCEIQI
jgi:site-specific DNA-methyltransferase (adenine-specific)